MRNNDIGTTIIAVGLILGILIIIGTIGANSGPTCAKYDCDNTCATGSQYCYIHKPYTGSSHSYKTSTSKNSSSVDRSANYSNSSTTSQSNATKETIDTKSTNSSKKTDSTSSSWSSYDDGYEDVYDNDDYDWDRYETDSDYADGVDDAMEDVDADW